MHHGLKKRRRRRKGKKLDYRELFRLSGKNSSKNQKEKPFFKAILNFDLPKTTT